MLSLLGGTMQVMGFRKDRSSFPWGYYAIPQRFRKYNTDKYLDFMRDCMPEIAVRSQVFSGQHY